MFIKENIEVVEKPKKKKRQLTERQLEGLKKGREKMAEKRRLKKETEKRKKELLEMDSKVIKETNKEQKKARIKKKITIQKNKMSEEEFIEKKKKGDKSSTKFNKLRTEALKNIKSTKEMEEFEKIMNGVNKEMERNPEELYKYLREHGDRLIGETKEKLRPKKADEKAVIEEEKNSQLYLTIDEL